MSKPKVGNLSLNVGTANMIEHKSFPIAGLKTDETGTIEAIVSVFNNVDLGKEKVMPGFFAKSIAKKLPKGVWAHDWTMPIAKTLEARELLAGDPLLPESLKQLGGAYIKGQFNLDTQRGREAYSDIKFGIVDEFSIGYKVVTDKKDDDGVRELIEGDWKEWSPVLVGMNPETALISIKADTKIVRKCDPEDMEPGKPWCLYSADGSKLLGRHATAQECYAQERAIETNKPKGEPPAGLTFADHSESVLAAVGEYTTRVTSLIDLRTKEGRVISSANRNRIQELRDALDSLLAASEPKPKPEKSLVEALRLESARLESEVIARLAGH